MKQPFKLFICVFILAGLLCTGVSVSAECGDPRPGLYEGAGDQWP